jgi:hypothetical protein
MNFIKSEYDFYQSINQQEQEHQYYYTTNEKVNRGGRKQVKTGTTKRNARERNRVRYINYCFDVLRQHIPVTSPLLTISDDQTSTRSDNSGDLNKKLSKVDTLKFATQYIKQLTILLEQIDEKKEDDFIFSEYILTPSTSPFSPSSTSTSSINQQYQDYNNNEQNKIQLATATPYNSYQPTNITLNNININIFNDNNEMQIDNSNQMCSFSQNDQNGNNFMETQNQYYQYYF